MRFVIFVIVSVILAFATACEVSNNTYVSAYGAKSEEVQNSDSVDNTIASTDEFMYEESVDYGGGGVATDFKVPLDPEYEWQITQSWANHCKLCNNKGYGKNDGTEADICTWSHSVKASCKYGWDFSLPGNEDEGKYVLATAEGTVKSAGGGGSWGNYVVIDHGNNVCSRYAHMQDNSVTVKKNDGVCQGLILGKVGDTGSSGGFHLHFQFEKCTDATPISKFFTDGNGVPMCKIGKDIYGSTGKYTALKLTNKPKESCDLASEFAKKKFNNGAILPVPGIKSVSCGPLPNCPLITTCTAEKNHVFSDDQYLTSSVRSAAQYLYGECALNGKDDGGVHQGDIITNAEGLKIAMYLFGQVSDCGNESAYVPFSDVKTTDWYYPLVVCGLKKGIVDNGALLFWANSSISFQTAAQYLVKSAEKAGVITVKNPSTGSFSKIPSNHPAYKYVETLYAYAAVDTYATSYYPETSITRGQFVRMAANLSPCYCDNISCTGGCKCDQANFACATSGSGSDVGGGSGSSGGSAGGNSGGSNSGGSSGSSGSDPCGGCPSGSFCNSKGKCQCMPNCPSTGCGSDGCGGLCECSSGYTCTGGQCVKASSGSNGCGSFSYKCSSTGMPCASPFDTKCSPTGGKCQKAYSNCPFGYSCNASGQCVPPSK